MTGSLANTIGAYNPFRFKGYYYDTETAMYYCQTRYYVPSWGRWLNSDHPYYLNPSQFMGMNLYAYCGNNPVMYTDPSGTVFLLGLILGAIIGAGIGFGIATYIDYKDDGEVFNGSVKWYEYLALTAGGAFIGGTVGAFLPEIGGAISAFAKTTFTIGNIISGAGTMAAVTVTGAQILVGATIVGGVILLSQIGKSGGYKIEHHYPNDHNPPHVHISGDDGKTRVDINGNPIQGDRPMTYGEKKAFHKLLKQIMEALHKWFPYL